MKFDIITIFPKLIDSYISESILGRAIKKKLIKVTVHDLRNYTTDKHKTVDDRPYGGGPGMIMKVEPFLKALQDILGKRTLTTRIKSRKKNKKVRVIAFDPAGKQFDQTMAKRFSGYDQLIMLSGRYEGFDDRVYKLVDELVSVGPYVLSGGELPALTVVEATARLLPGVLGHKDATKEETFAEGGDYVEYPQYTRPETIEPVKGKKWAVPKILLSGNHQKIKEWRAKKAKKK